MGERVTLQDLAALPYAGQAARVLKEAGAWLEEGSGVWEVELEREATQTATLRVTAESEEEARKLAREMVDETEWDDEWSDVSVVRAKQLQGAKDLARADLSAAWDKRGRR